MALLASCGGAGGTGTPATFSYPPSPVVLVVGTVIAPIEPTIDGTLTGFTVNPALPSGLSINPANGIISGTPISVAAQTPYVVSAESATGTATAQVSLTVNDIAPSSLGYPASAVTYTVGSHGRSIAPNVGGGAVVSWSVSPALPAGLSLDTTDGTISGTPASSSPTTAYVVTAQNSGGHATFTLQIEVDATVLLELGHQAGIYATQFSGSRFLSLDISGHWALWDYSAATIIVSGDTDCIPNQCAVSPGAALAGTTAVIRTQSGFDVYAADSGMLLSQITSNATWWTLASDGSYIAAGGQSAVDIWSPAAATIVTVTGNYSKAIAFAAPAQLRVALGPAGTNVVETIAVPGGADAVSQTFNGAFNSWFFDGARFLTVAGNTVAVYSNAAIQEGVANVSLDPSSSLGGEGNWYWTYSGSTLAVYGVGAGTTPAATYTVSLAATVVASGGTIAVVPQPGNPLTIVDLSATVPSRADHVIPGEVYALAGFSSLSASEWIVGESSGVLFDGASAPGAPRYFGFGNAWSISGGSGHIAIATASGQIVYFNSATLAEEGMIAYNSAKLAMSSDGTVLAALGDVGNIDAPIDWSVKIYSLPSGALLNTWSHPVVPGAQGPLNIWLSASGALLGQDLDFGTQQVNPTLGGSPLLALAFAPTGYEYLAPPIRLAPDDTRVANSSWTGGGNDSIGTNIYQGASLITALSGWPAGWMDAGHLLINTYSSTHDNPAAVYTTCFISDAAGHRVNSCALRQEVTEFQTVTSDLIYAANLNAILTVSSGAVAWISGNDAAPLPGSYRGLTYGAVAGSHAVFVAGHRVVAQSY